SVRRLKPHKHRQMLQPRTERELSFLGISSPQPRTLLYDTTVYIDILQGRFPDFQETMLRAADAWHSTVAESELASACTLLDPGHRNTRSVRFSRFYKTQPSPTDPVAGENRNLQRFSLERCARASGHSRKSTHRSECDDDRIWVFLEEGRSFL